MIKHAIYVAIACLIAAAILAIGQNAFALDQIIRPYQSIRSAGMGNVKITTGKYDQNFFGNPARVTANTNDRFQLFDLHLETTPKTISVASDLVSSGDSLLTDIAEKAGSNLHGRIQTAFPAYYWNRGKTSYAVGFIASTQFDVTLRRSFEVSPQALTDIGPAFTVGKKFLPQDRLSVGATVHATYRLASKRNYSFVSLLRGDSLSPWHSGADGSHIDMGIGGTYRFPFKRAGFGFRSGLSVNNVLGGGYTNLGLKVLKNVNLPPRQPRTLNFGFAAARKSLWKFEKFVGALEFTDIGNNKNGSFFRLIHLGAEAVYGILLPRFGINQGYLCAGLGFDFNWFTLDLATWGEEASLVAGGMEDRRVALRLAAQL